MPSRGSRLAATATYSTITANETNTYTYATPKPAGTVAAGYDDDYNVTIPLGPDVGYAVSRYTIRGFLGKTCVFSTTFTNMLQPGGFYAPKWNATATPSGGAICTATITSQNFTTHNWTVDFTMK